MRREEKGKLSKEWQFEGHTDEFYETFAKILEIAERLKIFVLPKAPNKCAFCFPFVSDELSQIQQAQPEAI